MHTHTSTGDMRWSSNPYTLSNTACEPQTVTVKRNTGKQHFTSIFKTMHRLQPYIRVKRRTILTVKPWKEHAKIACRFRYFKYMLCALTLGARLLDVDCCFVFFSYFYSCKRFAGLLFSILAFHFLPVNLFRIKSSMICQTDLA